VPLKFAFVVIQKSIYHVRLPISIIIVNILNSTQLNRRLRTQVSDTSMSASLTHNFFNSSDRFPVPVRTAVKSNLTAWCDQNLSKRALNAFTVLA